MDIAITGRDIKIAETMREFKNIGRRTSRMKEFLFSVPWDWRNGGVRKLKRLYTGSCKALLFLGGGA